MTCHRRKILAPSFFLARDRKVIPRKKEQRQTGTPWCQRLPPGPRQPVLKDCLWPPWWTSHVETRGRGSLGCLTYIFTLYTYTCVYIHTNKNIFIYISTYIYIYIYTYTYIHIHTIPFMHINVQTKEGVA